MTISASVPRQRKDRVLALLLAGLLYLTYLLTFSGVVRSNDEKFIVDTAESIAIQGSLYLNQTAYLRTVQTTDVELGQPLLSAPLYWIAYQIPWIGNAHTIMLFNLIVTALISGIFYIYARDLSYRRRTSLIGALLLGLTTILWPYSKTFFREPLSTLMLFGAAFLLNRWRQCFEAESDEHRRWLVAGVMVAFLAVFSKESAFLGLPFLLLIALPGKEVVQRHRDVLRRILVWLGIATAIAAALIVIVFLVYPDIKWLFATRYRLLIRLQKFFIGLPYLGQGLVGYLLSPGKSIWMYSPVLICALAAPFLLTRKRWRESWLVLAMTLFFAFMYAGSRGVNWHGGSGWGSRYMIPLTPFLMIAALPALDQIINSKKRLLQAGLVLLALWGFAVQLGGSYVFLHDYYRYQGEQFSYAAWEPQVIWSLRWNQAVGSLLYMPQADPDILWFISQIDKLVLAALAVGLAMFAIALVLAINNRSTFYFEWASPVLLAGLTLFGLARGYADPRYNGDNATLHEMRQFLTNDINPDDVILLSSTSYTDFFVNYYKGDTIWYNLPVAPGERYSCEQEPEVISDQVEALAGEQVMSMITSTYEHGWLTTKESIWLLVDRSPFLPCNTRPAEWFMNKTGYFVEEHYYSDIVRVLHYLSLDRTGQLPPGIDVAFGDSIRLSNYALDTLKSDTSRLQAGEQLGISLAWEALAPLETEYVSAVYFVGSDGAVYLQQDRPPVGGFEPTTTWQVGEQVQDNSGFIIPADMPAGEYELWLVLYAWPSLERLPVNSGDDEVTEHYLLSTVTIE